MNKKRTRFLALSLASIGAMGAFASVTAASLKPGTPKVLRDQAQSDIKEAIVTGDYQTFLAATKNSKLGLPILTEAQFTTIINAHKLRESGDTAGAEKLLADAGLKQSHGRHHHRTH